MNKIIEQIEKIKQINSNENLVIFVGAGVSKNSGVCSWWELVKEMQCNKWIWRMCALW